MFVRLFTLMVLTVGLLACVPDAVQAHGGRGGGVNFNFRFLGRDIRFFPRQQVFFAPSGDCYGGGAGGVQFYPVPPVNNAPVYYGGYGFQQQVFFAPSGGCYGGF